MSNAKRNKMRHKMWTMFREQGGSDIEISQDPLGARYEVNKFGIYVEGESVEILMDIRERVLATLIIGGWTIHREVKKVKGQPKPKLPSTFYATYPDAGAIQSYVDLPYELPTGGARLYVGVTSS